MKQLKDSKGNLIEEWQTVEVPEPIGNETHKNPFKGTITTIYLNKRIVVVENEQGESFEILAKRIKIIN